MRDAAARIRPESALEVGPGSGIYLPLLCQLFERVTAIDLESAYLDLLPSETRQLGNLSLIVDDITDTSLPPASFDLVLCSEVIEHIPDPEAALAAIRGLLRPGGFLVLTTPQPWSPIELLGKVALLPGVIELVRLAYREPILPTGHISLVSAGRVRGMLEGLGFVVRDHTTSGLYLPLVAELGGRAAVRVERALERRLRGGRLEGLLWTQHWVAEAGA